MVHEMLSGQRPFQMPEEMHPAARRYFHKQAHQTESMLALESKLPEGLANLGTTYCNLGEERRAIEFYEQWLAIAREIGDVKVAAMTGFSATLLLSAQDWRAEALRHAEFAPQVFKQLGHAQYAQNTQELIA